MKKVFHLLKEAAVMWMGDNAGRLSAALAYYSIFSLAPVLVIIVTMIGFVYGEEAARGRMTGQLESFVGEDAAETIQTAVAQTGDSLSTGIWAAVLGVGILLFGASTAVGELKNSINAIWSVEAKPGGTIRKFVRDRLLSISLVLCVGFLLLVSLALSTVLSAFSDWISASVALPSPFWRLVDVAVSLGVVTVLFGMIFKILPDASIPWRHALAGGLVSGLLFTFGKSLLSWYLASNSLASSFGAAGSLIVVLLWVFFNAGILFFGAEFVKAIVNNHGGFIPRDYARLADGEDDAPHAKSASNKSVI